MATIGFCGAFDGTVTIREGESAEQLHARIGNAMQNALDRSCKRLNVVVGVDHGELKLQLLALREAAKPTAIAK